MSDKFLGSQAPLYQNVHIRCINTDTGKVRLERNSKNRITRLMLWGISKFLAGEFNDSTPDKIYEYIPRYISFGTNIPGSDYATSGVNTSVTVNDTRLLNEITESSSTGETTSVKRIQIQKRQHSKTVTSFTDPFVKLSITMYVSSHQYDGLTIGEAGLFSKEKDNNCMARVVFTPFTKEPDEVIEINWDITLLSYGATKYPNNITINEANKIILPLYYSKYFIKTNALNLIYIPETSDSGWINLIAESGNIPLFYVDSDGSISIDSNVVEYNEATREIIIIENSGYADDLKAWKEYLQTIDVDMDNVIRQLAIYGKKSGDNIIFESSESVCSIYLSDSARIVENNTLIADRDGALLQDVNGVFLADRDAYTGIAHGKQLFVSRIYETNDNYSKEYTDYVIKETKILDKDGNDTKYILKDNVIYEKLNDVETSTEAYLENGYIKKKNEPTGYMYESDTGKIYKLVKSGTSTKLTSAFVVPYLNKYRIYQTTSYENVTSYSKYWIDWDNDKEVYHETSGDTEYHITSDLYFATGATHKLPYIITPSDATDKSVTWNSLNSLIARVSEYGIVTGWNVGETYVIVTTSNGIKARIIIEVVRDLAIVATSSITLTPQSIMFNVAKGLTQSAIVTAQVNPSNATYNVVEWSADNNGSGIFEITAIGNNKVKVSMNGTGNVGRGYVTARTADNASASCLIQVTTNNTSDTDCPDPSHDGQHTN